MSIDAIDPVQNTQVDLNEDQKGLIYGTYEFFRKIESTSHKFTKDATQMAKLRESLWSNTGTLKSSKEQELSQFYMKMAYIAAAMTAVSTVVSAVGIYQGMSASTRAVGDLYQRTGQSIGTLGSTVVNDVKSSYATPYQSEIEGLMNNMTKTWSHKQTEDDSDKEKKSSNEQRLNETIMQTLEKLSTIYTVHR